MNLLEKIKNASRLTWLVGAAVVVTGGLTACAGILADRPPFEKIGLALTWLGVAVALSIFSRQSSEHRAFEGRLHGMMRDLVAETKLVAVQTESASDSSEEDAYPEETLALAERGIDIGDGYRMLQASEVPLRVVGDLVQGWKQDGRRGRWTLGNLKWSVRKTGKGNHPWIVVFSDPKTGSDRLWKLSKGGRSNSEPTVDELTPVRNLQ